MKKVFDFVKPNILIILGGLMFLTFLNYLMVGGALVSGIIGVVAASFYITYGILSILIPSKISEQLNKIFTVIAVSLFAILIFVGDLLSLINNFQNLADDNQYNDPIIGPTGWTLLFVGILAALGFMTFFILSKFMKNDLMNRLAFLLTVIFALVLLADLLFSYQGFTNSLGDIPVVTTMMFALFIFYAFSNLNKLEAKKEAASKKDEIKEEEPEAKEEAPVE